MGRARQSIIALQESLGLQEDGTSAGYFDPFPTLYHNFTLRDLYTIARVRAREVHWASSSPFSNVIMVVIMLNSFVLGLEVNEKAIQGRSGHVDGPENVAWFYFEIVFSCIYLFEVCAKLSVDAWKFFEDGWNIFDYLIVSSTTASLALQLFAFEHEARGSSNIIAVLRVGRLFRLGRILRVVKGFKNLKYLYLGMFRSTPPLLYVFALLFFPIYFIASNTVCQLLPLNHPSPGRMVYFRTVFAGQFTWFEMTTGEARGFMRGVLQFREDPDISDVAEVARVNTDVYDVNTDMGNQMLLLFICGVVIIFSKYAVLSTTTGLVISRISSITDTWREEQQVKECEKQDKQMENISELFREGDADQDGRLTMTEFEATLQNPKLRESLAANLDVRPGDLVELFSMLRQMNVQGDVFVPSEEFLRNIILLRGDARAVHLYVLTNSIKKCIARCEQLAERVTNNSMRVSNVEMRLFEEMGKKFEKELSHRALLVETRVQSARAQGERQKLESAVDYARPRPKPGLSRRKVHAISRGEQVSSPSSRQGSRGTPRGRGSSRERGFASRERGSSRERGGRAQLTFRANVRFNALVLISIHFLVRGLRSFD
jgi:hypothetical protein